MLKNNDLNLKNYATTQGFGYKTANLRKLKDANISVPDFIGITSNTIVNALFYLLYFQNAGRHKFQE